MPIIRENLLTAFRALRENGLRSVLTMLGIIIGVGSVVLLIAIGQGVKEDVTRQIDDLGTNVLFVVPGKLDRYGQPNPMSMMGISTLTDRDVATLERLPGVTASVPVMFVYGYAERDGQTYSSFVVATTPAVQSVRPYSFTEGRFFRAEEGDARVCVMADGPKAEIFGIPPALGKTIRIRNAEFRVIGVLKPEENSLFSQFSFQNVIYIPLNAARKTFKGGQINRIIVQTDYRRAPAAVLASVHRVLLANHGGREDFGLLSQKQLLGVIYNVFNIVTALLVGISAISLVVAGIGIMNVMLVTVTERTREVGIRKTVGARHLDIFIQFLTEAITLSVIGGLAGIALAGGICAVVSRYSPLRPLVTPGAVLLAFGVCLLVGIIFGVAPAMRAARQDPIEALRWE